MPVPDVAAVPLNWHVTSLGWVTTADSDNCALDITYVPVYPVEVMTIWYVAVPPFAASFVQSKTPFTVAPALPCAVVR
jgi:hypothetical protein